MQVKVLNNLSEIDAQDWNNLSADNNPFVSHEFLSALENHQCVSEKFGWIARHIIVTDADVLVGAVILYEKYNNYGEFVFDHTWHNAYERCGLNYYPKLVSTTPYTPANGVRFLCQEQDKSTVLPILLDSVLKVCDRINASSFHCLFADQPTIHWLNAHNFHTRIDCQFHWHNQNYGCFNDFLQNLRAKKRKNIRQERQRVAKSAVTIRQLNGNNATDEDWRNFSDFYTQTFLEKNGVPTLNLGFFKQIARTIPEQVLLFLADMDGECVAGSLMFKSDTHLYGRHWGCAEQVDFLHFELCYYQGIEYCIKHGLEVFEPGAQGEHKVARGFLPVTTYSAHYLKHKNLREPIANFCEQEAVQVKHYIKQIQARNPYQETS